MSFVLYITYIFLLYLRPIEIYFPEMYEFRPVLIFSIITLISSLLGLSAQRSSVINMRHIGLIAAIAFIVPFSRVMNGWPGGALEALAVFSPSVATFVLTVINVNTLRKLRITLVAILACTSVLVAQSAYSYHTGFKSEVYLISQSHLEVNESQIPEVGAIDKGEVVLPVNDSSVLWRIRSVGELSDPNDFAQAILAAIPILFVGLFSGTRFEQIVIRLPLFCFLAYGLLLTSSRGAVVAAAGMIFFVAYRKLGRTGASVLLSLILFGGVALGFSGGRGISTGDASAAGRIDAWSAGFTALKQNPIFGVGFGRFLDFHPYTAHNAYVLALTELGMLGYFFLVALATNSLLELLRARRSLPAESIDFAWATSVCVSFIAIATSSMFLSRSYSTFTYLWIGLMACAGHVCRSEVSGNDGKDKIAWLKSAALFSFGSIVFLYFSVITHNLTR
jgi:putative inorganic carbon (hco3(-)) transporter